MPERIHDLEDSRIEHYRHVRDGALLRQQGMAMVEGRLLVPILLSDRSRLTPASLLLSDRAARAMPEAIQDAENRGVSVYVCTREMMEQIAGFDVHRGCLALAHRPGWVSIPQIIGSIAADDPGLVVALEGVNNHDNVGAIARAAGAFGAAGIVFDQQTADPYYRKALRVSMGAAMTQRWSLVREWPGDLQRLRAHGYEIVALVARGGEPIDKWARDAAARPERRVCVLVGAEGPGLSDAALEHADRCVTITMAGGIDSLSASMAAGIALHRATEAIGTVRPDGGTLRP